MKFSKIVYVVALLLLQACGGNNAQILKQGKEINLDYAKNLKLSEVEPGVTLAYLTNPWSDGNFLAKYALVDKNRDIPAYLTDDFEIIRVPLENSIVYSGVHVSLLDEFGSFNNVKGVCDVSYIHDRKTLDAIKDRKIVDCGAGSSPNIEKILMIRPEAVLLSPYENSDETRPFQKSGIKTILTADYMENTPLGRAEWMRFYGRLYGKGPSADSIFMKVRDEYESLKNKTKDVSNRPKVLFDRIYSGVWDVPTSSSVTGILINDAGGENPFSKFTQKGSAHLSAEEVLINAQNSDIWLIRYIEPQLTLDALKKDNPVYSRLKPFEQGNIYGSNTLNTNLFEDGAFHPERTLLEMIKLIHPEIESGDLKYYQKLK